MIRTTVLVAASRIIRDSETNRTSVIDVLDDFSALSLPLFIPRASVLWTLERALDDPQQPQGSITIHLNDAPLQEFPVNINFQEQRRTRVLVVINGLVIPTPGRLSFRAHLADTNTADAEYGVQVEAAPAQQGPPGSSMFL